MDKMLAVNLPGLTLKNPLMPASGTFGFGDTKAAQRFSLDEMGALVLKTTTPTARVGNPQPQIALVDDGVMNSVGLTNPGVAAVINDKLVNLRRQYPELPVIGSVGGSRIDDYVKVAQQLCASHQVQALELNISCPNVHEGGMAFGTDPVVAAELTHAVKQVATVPVYVKLSPNVTDIVAIAKAVQAAGADGISMINTVLGLHIDVETKQPVLGAGAGGYSGAAIKPIAVRMVDQVSRAVQIPIIAMGGIMTVDDVIEMYLSGADAVQIGSAHFKDALIIPHLAAQLPARLRELGYSSIEDLRQQVKAGRMNEA